MENITFQNIKVNGIPYKRILKLEITHMINEHASAYIEGEMEKEAAGNFLNHVNPDQYFSIETSADGQAPCLFFGIISEVLVEEETEYRIIKVKLTSVSRLLDYEKITKTFQNTAFTHEEICTKAADSKAFIDMEVGDRAIGSIVLQCNETNWEFIRRMASELGAPVITTITTRMPTLIIGLPARGKKYSIDQAVIRSNIDIKDQYNNVNDIVVDTEQYMFLGESVVRDGATFKIRMVKSSLEKGVLITTIGLGKIDIFKQNRIENHQIAGRMFTGTVAKVDGDKVQVDFTDINEKHDPGADFLFPYATPYASNDGSSYYSMPNDGDEVKVFFPDANPANAFATSGPTAKPAQNKTDKQWNGPNGKTILLTEKGIVITTNIDDNKIYIDLDDVTGINIRSNVGIKIRSSNNLTLMSNDKIQMAAKNNILLSTKETYMNIDENSIEMRAKQITMK